MVEEGLTLTTLRFSAEDGWHGGQPPAAHVCAGGWAERARAGCYETIDYGRARTERRTE